MKKKENISQEMIKTKKSFKETITLMFRKKWLTNTAQTTLIVAILVALFILINVWVQSLDLQVIDVTDNKIYTLSDTSKEAISKINEDVKVYVYGIAEDSSIVSFIKQYISANNHISYEILTEESNKAKVDEFELSEGYQIIVLETATSSKIIDIRNEFYSYDYTTGQEIDLTEECLTNSLLAITTENKPNLYFTTGHEEYDLTQDLGILNTYLVNEAYNVSELNLLTEGKVPDNCNLLLLMRPTKDFTDVEVNYILDYINRGGNLVITSDVGNVSETYSNLQRVLDAYGVKINHTGYVYENETDKVLSGYPNIFTPTMSSTSEITRDIYTSKGRIWFVYSGRLTFVTDEELSALNVEREDVLTSSESSLFIPDMSATVSELIATAEKGSNALASVLTKTITPAVEASEGVEAKDAVTSKLLVIANTVFTADVSVSQIGSNVPLSYVENNKDFMLNAVSVLTEKENTLKIRKDMSTSTYLPTDTQDIIVLSVIFGVPVLIILAGIVVWNYRRRKR